MSLASPSVADLVRAAAGHLAHSDRQSALADLAAAGTVDPDYLPLHFVAGLLAWQMGDYPKALHLLKLCSEQAPMNGTVAEVLASLHAQTGSLVESVYQGKLATALEADAMLRTLIPPGFPSFDSAFRAYQKQPLLASARRLAAEGRWREALEQARQHLDIAPEDLEARHFYVETLLRLGKAGAAVEAAALSRGEPLAPVMMSLHARALTAVGEFGEARRRHDEACAAAPDDAAIAAARAFDAAWFGAEGEASVRARDWAARFAKPLAQRRRRPLQGKLVIGYLVSGFSDGEDAVAVARVARAHDRSATTVIGYGAGGQTWPENAKLGGAFDRWCDTRLLDPATLARIWAGDGLDVLIDAGGLASATNLLALSLADPIRVAWLGASAGLGRSVYDAVIAGPSTTPDPGEALRHWTVACGAYPLGSPSPMPSRPAGGDAGCIFGADVRLCHLGPDTVARWSAILQAVPGATLLLRDNDMRSPANIDRLVARFGRDLASRVDLVEAGDPRDFYAHIDVALAPLRSVSARLVAEPLALGVPVVAASGQGDMGRCAGLLLDQGLGSLVVSDTPEAYIGKAAALAHPERRAQAADQVRHVDSRGGGMAREIAGAIEGAARDFLAEAAA